MKLSNLNPKYKPCLGPSSLSQSLTENSCVRQLWLQNRFKSENNDSIFLERFKLQHTSSLNGFTEHLRKIYPFAQIDCEVQMPIVQFHGINLFGIADCILTQPDGSIGIYDVKTGSRKSSHWLQIGLYFLMQKAIKRSHNLEMPKLHTLGLFYSDGKTPIDKETFEKCLLKLEGDSALDQIFLSGTKNKLREILLLASQKELPASQPSINNCKYCKFKNDCPDSIKENGPIIANDLI